MIAHVALLTTPADGPAAIAFWQELGFVQVEPPASLCDRAAWLERCGTQIHLLWSDAPTAQPQDQGHVAVVVADYEATLVRLNAAGYAVAPRREHWGAKRAQVLAPGGHRVELMAAAPTRHDHISTSSAYTVASP